jgi:Mlc titration factor MtfA (ptsG expression regulator)
LDFIAVIIFLLILLVLIAFIITMPFLILGEMTKSWQKKMRFTVFPNLKPKAFTVYQALLLDKFAYFRLLDDREQRIFVSRLRYVRDKKQFVGRDIDITEEMEVIVSASLVQLTFGLKQFDLEQFDNIHITPAKFYSGIIGAEVKGLTLSHGRILLSWADFQKGYLVHDDKINLGLHEWAHALRLDYFASLELDTMFDDWHVSALHQLQLMHLDEHEELLRDYASTNIEEFWACAVETFFEAPLEFRELIPDLYAKMCLVLNQDMAARVENAQRLNN